MLDPDEMNDPYVGRDAIMGVLYYHSDDNPRFVYPLPGRDDAEVHITSPDRGVRYAQLLKADSDLPDATIVLHERDPRHWWTRGRYEVHIADAYGANWGDVVYLTNSRWEACREVADRVLRTAR
jgi:hypothetical protein